MIISYIFWLQFSTGLHSPQHWRRKETGLGRIIVIAMYSYKRPSRSESVLQFSVVMTWSWAATEVNLKEKGGGAKLNSFCCSEKKETSSVRMGVLWGFLATIKWTCLKRQDSDGRVISSGVMDSKHLLTFKVCRFRYSHVDFQMDKLKISSFDNIDLSNDTPKKDFKSNELRSLLTFKPDSSFLLENKRPKGSQCLFVCKTSKVTLN